MRNRTLRYFALTAYIAILATIGQAAETKRPTRRLAGTTTHRVKLAASRGKQTRRTGARRNWRNRGQQAMEAKRIRQIQAALIRENYLQGRANGIWDQRSKQAMARLQSDNHWQCKVVPDSRALIKLGLGPDYAGLINPKTAVISFIPNGRAPVAAAKLAR